MVTSSEIVVTAVIWVLTTTGGFFGIRAAVRRKKAKVRATTVKTVSK